MPVGIFDKRRGGHRCGFCSRTHRKCDGRTPCSNCKTRSLQCSLVPRETELQVVNVTPAPAPRRALVENAWKYTTVCFESLIGPPEKAILRSDFIVSLSQTDHQMNKTIVTFGRVYSSCFITQEVFVKSRPALLGAVAKHKMICRGLLGSATAGQWSSTWLAGALMLVPMDSMLTQDKEEHKGWMRLIGEYIHRGVRNGVIFSAVDQDLIRFYQSSDVMLSLMTWERPLGHDFSARLISQTAYAPLNRKRDLYLSSHHWWAMLQHSMMQWDIEVSKEMKLSLDQKIRGMEMIEEVSALQSTLLPLLLDASNSTYLNPWFPLYCWPLIGICQLLRRDAWQLLECDLPALSPDKAYEQANALLDTVFSLMRWRMCVPFFLPLVYTAGFEMRTEKERERVLRCMNDCQIKHYDMVKMFQMDLVQAWRGTDRGSEGVCDRRLPMHERARVMALMLADSGDETEAQSTRER